MATVTETFQIHPPEPISISVQRIRFISSKGVAGNASVRIDFGERTLGESPKFAYTHDAPIDLNFSAHLICNYDDPLSLDEIVHKPIVVSILEVAAKEKKSREEKTTILGQSCIDLLPFVQGVTEIIQTLTVNSTTESFIENSSFIDPKIEIDVKITAEEPILNESQISGSNLMTISVGSLYSPPEYWNISGASNTYGVILPAPLTGDKEIPVVFTNGKLRPAQDKEGPKVQKRWAFPGTATGIATLLEDKFMFADPVENEDGDFKTKDDLEHRRISQQEKSRVSWNMERRCFLQPSAIKSFEDYIAKKHYWPVEIVRLPSASTGKGKKEDDGSISFRGIAFLNLSSLLYPGLARVKGAFRVYGYSDTLLFEKTKRKSGVLEDASKFSSNTLLRSIISPFVRGVGKEPEKRDARKASGVTEPTAKIETGQEYDSQAQALFEAQQYNDAKTYIMIEICLDKPLIPKRTQEELVKRVTELIPPRPLFPKRSDRAQKVVEDFHAQVATVAGLILDEFREQFGDELKNGGPQDSRDMESRRQKLVYELNATGKYFAIKEQLKHSVVKIVREKYLRITNFENKQELQTFLSELYVYLIDEMHVSLNKVLALEDQPPVPKPLTDSKQLRHFAIEAEINQNFDLAASYYKERIARNRNDADCWLDYGAFNLYINEITKAEECFKECLSTNQKHLPGLLLYGIVCVLAEKNETAETFLEAATCIHPKSILAWTILGLFYDDVSNEIGAEMAYAEANKLNKDKAAALAQAIKDEQNELLEEMKRQEKLAAEARAQDETMAAASEDVAHPPTSIDTKTGVQDKTKSKSTGKGLMSDKESEKAVGNKAPAVEPVPVQEEPPPRDPTPVPATSIFMQAVNWLLEVKAISFTQRALGHELLTCPGGPNTDFHLAMAKLCLQKGDYAAAEISLNNVLENDIKNQDAWSLMGHVKYLQGDMANARDCYERTLSFIDDASETHSVYIRLASIYLQEKKYQEAKDTFLMACKKSPSCISWLGVGIACYRLDEMSEAEDALSEANILNNNDPEVWAYLSLVCLKTNRCLQAEQAYKYAIKLNLEEGPLLAEIHTEQARLGFGNPTF